MLFLILACIFAAMLGFAAHRASICTVRAMAEIVSARTAYMLASIGKSALWVTAITVPFLWFSASGATHGGWQLTGFALLGGLLFGIGAAMNGACAYSTMTRLVDGEVGMLLTIFGFALGVLGFVTLVDWHWLSRPVASAPLVDEIKLWFLLVAALFFVWSLYEMTRLWRTRPPGSGFRELVLAPQYRLSSAALVIGLSSAMIFLMIGSPGYTATLQNIVENVIGTRQAPAFGRWVLVLAVLVGMALSTWQRGSFYVDWRPRWSWLRNIGGGMLMGLGTALLPGGNDALVLYGIPSFSPHALPAFAALALGAAIGLLGMRHLLGADTRVVCRNDIYLAEKQPRGALLNAHPPQP